MDEPQWGRLAERMRERRADLRLSSRRAAKLAVIDPNTWASAEKGNRIRDTGFPGIEAALQWSPGSVREILAGGEPTLALGATQTVRPDSAPSTSLVREPRVVRGTGVVNLGGLHAEMRQAEPYDLAEEVERISQLHDIPVEKRMQMVRQVVEMHKERLRREEAARAS